VGAVAGLRRQGLPRWLCIGSLGALLSLLAYGWALRLPFIGDMAAKQAGV